MKSSGKNDDVDSTNKMLILISTKFSFHDLKTYFMRCIEAEYCLWIASEVERRLSNSGTISILLPLVMMRSFTQTILPAELL